MKKIGDNKRVNITKRVILSLAIGVFVLFCTLKIWDGRKSTDLQTLLQTLPKEISHNIMQAANNHQRNDVDVMQQFERLFDEIRRNQEDQARQLEKQRRVLERKLQKIKHSNEGATFRERLAFAFEYDSSTRFPAFIWQLIRADQQDIPQQEKDTQLDPHYGSAKNWAERNPGFVHETLNEHVMTALVRHYYSSVGEVVEAYNALPDPILKVDFFKYLILYARGGVYADIGTSPLQPIPNWIPENIMPSSIGLIIGIEHDAETEDWASHFLRRLQFGTWIIQCKPGHPVLREVIARITEETLKRKRENNLHHNLRNKLNIMSWTGSGVWTDVIFTYFNDFLKSGIREKITWKDFQHLNDPKLLGDVLVFPKYSFDKPATDANSNENTQYHLVSQRNKKIWDVTPAINN